ncbi:CBS domain containing-hemolysin-like protein [Motilibacter rhizosphaerae]|uniref:CBS domain containing-hemolysin-like protein n=1 Tax=Motilibacter rhizosphaerae TaxID=598652 RepID=A0A4Q7NSH6_9ACTN|nr:hemolysin family protein [Motilibacter rhizosphaerae]RZS89728.1 CBS domain containing-hemolysin-like protein [Motilibacter rhizosphaerae]
MSAADAWVLAGVVVLVLVAAVLAMAEAALSRVGRSRVEELVREGRRGADALHEIAVDAARYLNVLTFLRVAAEALAASLLTWAAVRVLGLSAGSVLLAGAVFAVASYVGIGVSPRTLGRQHADTVGLVVAPGVRRIALLLGPLTSLLILVGNALTPGRGFAEGPFASEAELRDLVDLAQENAVIDTDERAMIHSVFELADTVAREIMVPRTDMVWIERHKTLRQALSLALRSGFSRIPVIGESLDDVVGVVYLKDLVRRTHDEPRSSALHVETAMRPAAFVPESKRVDALLREMQAQRNHLAVVIDEYGGVAGLCTIEDVLEEIVGDISDEYDSGVPDVQHLDERTLRVSARLNLGDLSEILGVDLEDEDVDSVGGLLAKHLGRVPIPGARVEVAGIALTAESGLGRRNRVATVLVEVPEPAAVDEPGAEQDGPSAETATDQQEQVHQ